MVKIFWHVREGRREGFLLDERSKEQWRFVSSAQGSGR